MLHINLIYTIIGGVREGVRHNLNCPDPECPYKNQGLVPSEIYEKMVEELGQRLREEENGTVAWFLRRDIENLLASKREVLKLIRKVVRDTKRDIEMTKAFEIHSKATVSHNPEFWKHN